MQPTDRMHDYLIPTIRFCGGTLSAQASNKMSECGTVAGYEPTCCFLNAFLTRSRMIIRADDISQ